VKGLVAQEVSEPGKKESCWGGDGAVKIDPNWGRFIRLEFISIGEPIAQLRHHIQNQGGRLGVKVQLERCINLQADNCTLSDLIHVTKKASTKGVEKQRRRKKEGDVLRSGLSPSSAEGGYR